MISPPPVLTIAGSDSSCGAGIQADLKAISALGGYALTALTSVVSESPGKVSLIHLLDPEIITDQIRVLFTAFPVRAAKTGMLGGAEQVEAVVDAWRSHARHIPLVVDPVMVATGGGKLMLDDAISAIQTQLLPLATLITPNLDEAAVLWKQGVANREDMAACAWELAQKYQTSVLLKGGHLSDDSAADVLCTDDGLYWLEADRTPDVQTHGTGCTYSASIATGLAQGLNLLEAVTQAKGYISAAITDHFQWQSPLGTVQALNHLHQNAQ